VPLTSLVNIADIESRIPLSEDQNNSWKEIPETGSGKAIRYKLERGPFSVCAHDSILEVSTELRYQLKYAQRVKQPWPFTNYTWITIGSCGYNEPMRRIRVVLTSNLTFQSDWNLRSSTKISTEFIDKCQATILNFDITGQVKEIIDKQLADIATKIDRQVPEAVNIHAKAEELWQRILQPIAIGQNPGLWLATQPHGIQLTPPKINNAEISFTFYLRCKPLITLGDRPEPSKRAFIEIPAAKPDSGFHIELLLNFSYQQAAEVLRQRFVGTSHTFSGTRTVQIDSISLFGDEIATTLAIDFHGDIDGRILLTGVPTYSSSTNTIFLADLDYSISTRNIFFKISDWWSHNERVAELRQHSQWEITRELQSVRTKLNSLLNETGGTALVLGGKIQHLRCLGLISTRSAVVCYTEADGSLQLKLK